MKSVKQELLQNLQHSKVQVLEVDQHHYNNQNKNSPPQCILQEHLLKEKFNQVNLEDIMIEVTYQ